MKQQLLRREQFEQCAHSGRGRLLELLHLYDVRRPGKVRSERIAFEAISFGRRLSPLPKELFCSLNFDLLENPRSELELCQLSETSRPRSTLAIINDIGVDRKLKSYFATQELSSVKALYEYRLHACHSLCELDQLPRVDELDELLCEEQYDACLEFMSISHPRLLVALNANQPNSKTEFKELCNRVISRALTHYSLEERGFDPESLLLFSEQKLRNAASSRLKLNRGAPYTWRELFSLPGMPAHALQIVERVPKSGKVGCQGILLAFLENLSLGGVASLKQLNHSRSRRAFEKAEKFYLFMQEVLAERGYPMEGWSMNICSEYWG